jgi:glycosyltransferase involved in cell wall biosynthesis
LQGSYSEGFPNALLESCVVGTPVIAFNVPGGTKEIIEDGVNGFLVKNENEFLEKLNDNRIWDPEAIRESVVRKFSKEKILKQYENLFLDILK